MSRALLDRFIVRVMEDQNMKYLRFKVLDLFQNNLILKKETLKGSD